MYFIRLYRKYGALSVVKLNLEIIKKALLEKFLAGLEVY